MIRMLRHVFLLILSIVTVASVGFAQDSEAPARTVNQVSLYADVKAHSVGDILTVAIVERASASNSEQVRSRRNTQTSTSAEAGTGAFSFLPEFGMSAGSNRTHEGSGISTRDGRLTARMAVTIQEVRSNGDLVVSGNREVEVNDETEILTLTGTVRPSDIQSGNVVFSSNIADAQISYKTKGRINKESRPNIIMRVLGWIF